MATYIGEVILDGSAIIDDEEAETPRKTTQRSLSTNTIMPVRPYPTFDGAYPKEVIRGGFAPLPKSPKPSFTVDAFRQMPPPPNAAYSLDTHAYFPKVEAEASDTAFKPYEAFDDSDLQQDDGSEMGIGRLNLDGTSNAKDSENDTKLDQDLKTEKAKSKGEELAERMSFEHNYWEQDEYRVSGGPRPFPFFPPAEQKKDFIDRIDTDPKLEFEFCYRCKTRHIVPGPPRSMGQRDACLSALPDWFPRNYGPRAWERYNRMLNEMVSCHEALAGYGGDTNLTKPKWNLHFHEKNANWTTQHSRRFGGWWKCRSGPNTPEAERQCQHCHRRGAEAEPEIPATEHPVAQYLQSLNDNMESLFREQGEKDKKAALAMLREQGIPRTFAKSREELEEERLKLMSFRGSAISTTQQRLSERSLTVHAPRVAVSEDEHDPETSHGRNSSQSGSDVLNSTF